MDNALKLQMFFQTLGEANRLKIIKFIGNKEHSVSEIVKATGLSQPLVSHHLKTLRQAHVLDTKRQGPFVYYKLKDKKLLDALGLFNEIVNSIGHIHIKERMFRCPPWWERHWDRC